MQKKSFIFTTIIIALLIFSILPIINYISDPSRVLHHDYVMRYKKFHQHELVLKTIYVIEHKHDYDTLVFGSSRGGFMDMTKISKHAYNMSHGFGTVSTYLHTLETLLNSGVTVKNVWIGINDYDIWKDHTEELPRLVYHNSLLKDAKLYAHWLFRFIPESFNIIKDNKPLLKTDEVTDQEARLARSRHQEKDVRHMNHRHLGAAKLGYTGKFRIEKSIEEIKKIKKLCDTHHIKLTAFIYPTYYKTYLFYDQDKIEIFKQKLAQVMDFYDFYDIGAISLDQHNWFECSHFVTSIGDTIIESIHAHKHLVTKDNIDQRIQQTRSLLQHMPIIDNGEIYSLSEKTKIDTTHLKTIFDIKDTHFTYGYNQLTLYRKKDGIHIEVDQEDPYFILNQTHASTKEVILNIQIQSQVKSIFQLYFKKTASSSYAEADSFTLVLHKGTNHFNIVLPSIYINNTLRVDLTRKSGDYIINEFMIHEVLQ